MSLPSVARAGARPVQTGREGAVGAAGGAGVTEWLLAAWIFLEFAKPLSQTFRIPLLISAALFFVWLSRAPKRRPLQLVCMAGFVAVMAVHVPFALNNFSAFWTTYSMVVTTMIACAVVQFANSVAKVRFLVNALTLAFVVIGGWATTHGGFGPLGASSGQDENYVGQAMSVAFPLGFFSSFMARSRLLKFGYAASTGVFVAATIVGFSRGAFLGLSTAGLYCWARSPRKLLTVLIAVPLGLLVLRFTPAEYWSEVGSIEDEAESPTDLRWDLWKIAWRMFLDHPVAGVGPGNFKWWAGEYQSHEQLESYDRSFAGVYVTHSLYFEVLSEMGAIGVLLVAVLIGADVRDKRRIAKLVRLSVDASPELRDAKYLERGLTGAMLGFLVCTAFLANLYGSYLWILVMLTAALRASTESLVSAAGPPGGSGVRGAGTLRGS